MTDKYIYSKKTGLPEDFSITDKVRKWAKDKGHTNLEDRLEHFILTAEKQGYKYKNWNSAFQCAIRDDWAGLNKSGGKFEDIVNNLKNRSGDDVGTKTLR